MSSPMSSPLDQLVRVIVRLIKRAFIKFPQLALRFLEITFNPSGHLRQLALVLCVQISSFLLQRLRNQVRRGLLIPNKDERALDDATTYQQYKLCQQRIEAANPQTLRGMRNDEFFELMRQRASTYAKLQANGDEFGLMYHLRSELMRKQSGGAGYSRDGSTWLRKHRAARERIEEYQHQVCSALRYIASGVAPGSSRPAQRLAFINETRHAFGRTALLLSGGAAFGVKHMGVVSALQREGLLPRIIAGTSAGSIVAACVCSRKDDELRELLDLTGPTILQTFRFFGLRNSTPSASAADLERLAADTRAAAGVTPGGWSPADMEDNDGERNLLKASTVDWDLKRHLKRQQQGKTMLDNTVLETTLINLIGYVTFLEAFDRTGRVLNITVTRSDGKAPPLLCNYLTTPHMLVHCASLASCAIPGVFEAVELQAKGRDGRLEPYFKTGNWTWTDGGMQADLPKERLMELFNVNQFIVSQVSPLAPLSVPIDGTGLPWLEQMNNLLKCQLIGFLQGANKLWSGRLLRPGGFRGVDFILQDYEGTVTIRPSWGLREMSKFLSNFDQERVKQYTRDGERATWPHLELIRSLCEIEFCLDEVAAGLQQSIAVSRAAAAAASADTPGLRKSNSSMGGASAFTRGKLPSYIQLSAYDGDRPSDTPPASTQSGFPIGRSGSVDSKQGGRFSQLPGVASSASMLNLAALDTLDNDDSETMPPSMGMAPFQ